MDMDASDWFKLSGRKVEQMGVCDNLVWFYTDNGLKYEIKAESAAFISADGRIQSRATLILRVTKQV